jgi:hypothetical protein
MNKILIFISAFLITACSSAQKDSCDYTQEDRFYAGRSKEECKVIDYKCADQWKPFTDDCGCGCYKQDIDSFIEEILEDEPVQDGIDISNKTPFIVKDGKVEITFYLNENQSMTVDGNNISFNSNEATDDLPLKVKIEGEEPENYTMSGSSCSISKRKLLYFVDKGESTEFTLAVSLRDGEGASKMVSRFVVTVVSK